MCHRACELRVTQPAACLKLPRRTVLEQFARPTSEEHLQRRVGRVARLAETKVAAGVVAVTAVATAVEARVAEATVAATVAATAAVATVAAKTGGVT